METSTIKCPSCGGDLRFEPGIMSLTCPYCGTQVEQNLPAGDVQVEEHDFYSALASFENSQDVEDVRIASCPACQAEVTFRGNETTAACDFCGTQLHEEGKSHKAMLPQYLLPFKIKRSEAMEKFRSWIGKGFFAPSSLSRLQRVTDPLKGIYFPFWTYDGNTSTSYSGQRGDYYYVTEERRDSEGNVKQVQVRHTRWSSTRGHVSRSFDDLLIPGTRSVPEKLLKKLDQWDLSELKGYDTSYLAGFKAESYSVDLKEGFEKVKEILTGLISGDIRRDIGGDEQRIDSRQTRFADITFKYLLLPVWTMKYRYKDKFFQVLVNARTGELEGQKPVSPLKVILFILGILLVGGAAAFAIYYFGGS